MNQVRAYHQKNELSTEVRQKLSNSKQETQTLTLRDINCPYCGFLVERVFSDISGHKIIFCKKCKQEYPVNLGYFRRMKHRSIVIHQRRERQRR